MNQVFSKIDSDHPVSLIAREGAPWYLENGDLRQVPYDPRYNDDTGQRMACPETDTGENRQDR